MLTVRTALPSDFHAVRQIDQACFPAGDHDLEPALPGELEGAVENGDTQILELDGRPVAYAYADTQRPHRIYIGGFGVLPEVRNRGLGSHLLDECLARFDASTRSELPIVTVTSPRNLIMLRIIHARGFRARQVLLDHFGPGRDRLGCQLSVTGARASPAEIVVLPGRSVDRLRSMLVSGEYALEAVQRGDRGELVYALGPVQVYDFPSGSSSIWS